MTIEGNKFGANKGKVFFTSASDGGQSYLKGLDAQYIDAGDWSDTKIKVKVPSMVKDGYSGADYGIAGDGPIKIITADGKSCVSPNYHDLYIPYAIYNNKLNQSEPIRREYIVRRHCDYDFMFTLHKDYNTFIHYNKIDVIETALSHWSSLTGLTLILERNSNGQPVFESSVNDNKNMILPYSYYNGTPPPNAAMGTLDSYGYVKINNVPFLYRSYYKSHIYIKDESASFIWNYNLTGTAPSKPYYSFYQGFMHELGHILMLDHVNDKNDLMFYNLPTYPQNIVNINSISQPVLGVDNNIKASKGVPWPTSTPPFYPPGALKAKFVTTKSCYGANNGTIITTVTGGKSPYTFTWKKDGVLITPPPPYPEYLTNLAPGNYTLTLRDALNCIQNYTVPVQYEGGSNPLTISFTKIPANATTPELWRAKRW